MSKTIAADSQIATIRARRIDSTIAAGDRVETVGLTEDDSDTGRVVSVDGDTAKVAWASGVRTSCPLSSLRLI